MTDAKEAAKRAYDREHEQSEKTRAEGKEKLSKGKPTPTQEENDRTKMGEYIQEHEEDGSGPDPHAPKPEQNNHKTRHMEAGQRDRNYQTRTS
ncbi:hypothetical protein [Bradyrhizobium elkanii]|uniref:hypothetical protein n=1 Tax=Bradyrhizobium elkanii TaxID=29448 RepID=UPI000416E94B|nr:hypothetical protein [Bradyrhizobium elkanii]